MRVLAMVWMMAAVCAQGDDGERIYQGQCAFCHGQEGEGGRGPSLRKARLRLAPDDAALQRVIRFGTATGMPRTSLGERELAEVAAYVRKLGRVAPAALPGDKTRGAAVYGKLKCDGCHTIGGRGGAFGPDLSDVGLMRSAAYLEESIRKPEADIASGFVLVRVLQNDGKTVAGARVNEDTFSIQLRDASGRLHSFWKNEVREVKKDPKASGMPAYAGVAKEEMQDLVAYLASLEGAR